MRGARAHSRFRRETMGASTLHRHEGTRMREPWSPGTLEGCHLERNISNRKGLLKRRKRRSRHRCLQQEKPGLENVKSVKWHRPQ